MMMLSRVAENLFWLGRYVERAENASRLLDTGRRMAALPGPDGNRNEWASILASSGSEGSFPATGSPNSRDDVVRHIALSPLNPASICSSLSRARTNARATRAGLSYDSWRAVNDSWLDFQDMAGRHVTGGFLADLIDRTKDACSRIVGSFESTIVRDETYDFIRMGALIERADNTARILDVKYFSLLPPDEKFEGRVDTYQWMTILGATSTRLIFRRLYGADLRASRVVGLLVQNARCARSLLFCVSRIHAHLINLRANHGGDIEASNQTQHLLKTLFDQAPEDIIIGGLHEFLGDFIRANNVLADQIAADFHFYPTPPSTPGHPPDQIQGQTSA